MLKHRHGPIPLLLLTLATALACDRVPLSLGTGLDDLVDDGDDSSSGGFAGTGAGGFAGTGADDGTSTGVGGGGSADCNDTYILCLESGELAEICRDDLERCTYAGYPGTAGTGAGGTSTGTGGFAGTGAGGTSTGAGGSAGTGAGGGTSTGTGGFAGTGAGGAASTDCNDTYIFCLESGELAEICRDDLERCVYAGYPGTAGTGAGGGSSSGSGGFAGTSASGGSSAGGGASAGAGSD